MLKINHRKVISGLAAATWKANKKRNLLTISAIFLTTFLIASVLAIGASYWDTLSLRQLRMTGMDYDISLPEPREDQVETLRAMNEVRYVGLSIKCAIATRFQDSSLEKTRLYYVDSVCWEKQCVPAMEVLEGSYPQNENEILLSSDALRAMGIETPVLGQELTLDYETLAPENDGASRSKTFILSGWYRNYSGNSRGYVSKAFQEASGVTQTTFTLGDLLITLKNPLYSEKDIIRMQNALNLDSRQLIEADTGGIREFVHTQLCLAGLLLMVFFSGYLFIHQTLYISISKDIRYYGQLKTLGMTAPQLRGMIYREALWNSAVGIPLGLTAGVLASARVIPGVLTSIASGLTAQDVSSPSPAVWLIAGLFALLTNLLGSRKPVKIAENCSPIEAARFISIASPGGKRKRPRILVKPSDAGGTHLPFPLVSALRNMFRDKKQAAVILLSFTTALSIFLSVYVLIEENDAKTVLNAIHSEDISFLDNTTLDQSQHLFTEDTVEKLREISGVKSVRKVISAEIVMPYRPNVFDDYFTVLCGSRYSPGNLEEFLQDYQKDPASPAYISRLMAVDEEGFALLNASVGNILDQEAFLEGKTAVAINPWSRITMGDWETANAQMLGKEISFSLTEEATPEESHTVTIAAVTANDPGYFSGGYPPKLIVSEKLAETLMKEPYLEKICVEYEEPFSDTVEQQVKAVFTGEKNISWTSKLESYRDMLPTERQVRVLGLSLGLIIAFLALLNYCNMMAASVQDRSREFATLESIGMTGRQARLILAIEGACYALLSIAASLAIGTPISMAVFEGTKKYDALAYRFPRSGSAALYLAILALCVLTPMLLYQRQQKEGLMERLKRNE